jgi:triosephosphate isomerase
MRSRFLIANWKMNLPPEGIDGYVKALVEAPAGDGSIVVAPPYPYIRDVVERGGDRVAAGAQNCGDHKWGAFTGEVSAWMLRYSGASYAIVGHSERRHVYHESDALVAARMSMAIEAGLTPVLCVGEEIKARDAGHAAIIVSDQIKAAATPALESATRVIIAYEPVWAIGTGRVATGAICAEMAAVVRDALGRFWPSRHADASVLYGGSVTPENVGDLVANGNVDGFLVGGSCLDSERFLAIYRAM